MKVKVLSRNPDDYRRETKRDIFKVPRNYDPALHPLEVPREYQRALNAAKLERVFAKPFLRALEGHREAVHCLARHPTRLSTVLSGACDGELRVWSLGQQECVRSLQAHVGFVRGVCVAPEGDRFFTVGDDKMIKRWKMDLSDGEREEPVDTIVCKGMLSDIDHHWQKKQYATCGHQVQLWDEERSAAIQYFQWSTDTVTTLRFNPSETHLLGAVSQDRGVLLYDLRGDMPLRKVTMALRTNRIAWNPMQPMTFTAANEDYNLYTFDVRRLARAVNVHRDHVAAVLDVDYSPTGREFVSASFDKSVRIFDVGKGHSRDVYHTKRMQRVWTARWTADDKYIVSGSDETNLRLWKARASEKLGLLSGREADALNYSARLKEKFGAHPQVSRIVRHRHVPKSIYHSTRELNIMRFSRKRKEANLRKHSKAGAVPHKAERERNIVKEDN